MSCVFCEIVAGRIPSKKISETASFVAFRDIQPAAPTHILFVPKKHLAGIQAIGPPDIQLVGELCAAAAEMARLEGLSSGYRLVFNSGVEGGQSVDHLHLHLLGGRKMNWPPG